MEAQCGFRIRQRLPGPPVHASRLRGLAAIRHEGDGGPDGSTQSLYLVVSDMEAARDQLAARGVDVSEAFHLGEPGSHFQPDGSSGRLSGPAPDHTGYRSYGMLSDPEGNSWLLQEVTTQLAGRVDLAATTFASANDRASAFRRAAAWYAACMLAEPTGEKLPQ